MNVIGVLSNFVDLKNGRHGAGTSVLRDPVAAPVRLATLA